MEIGLEIAASRHILWPCNCFTASVPHRGKNRLNIFEETVLALTALSSGDTAALAVASCLKEDLVSFIQNRLALNGFLDSRMEITDSGKVVLKKMEDEENKNYVSAHFFLDLINGTMLPFVHTGVMEYKSIVEHSENRIKFKKNPTDDRNISASIIKGEFHRNKRPNPKDIIQAIRAFKTRFSRYASFTGNTDAYPLSIPQESKITIGDTPEPVFLHCKAFIQKSDPDTVVVTDGFGFGYSDAFANHLMKTGWSGIDTLKNDALIQSSDIGKDGDGRPIHAPKIHRIARLINAADDTLADIKKLKLTGKAAEKETDKNLGRALRDIYDALERTLVQVVFDFPVPDWERIYAHQSFEDNNEILESFARKLNLIVSDRNRPILKVKKGAINHLKEGTIEMQSALTLAITGAACSSSHPFNLLALKHPDTLSMICNFKVLRDAIQHGVEESKGLRNNVQYYLEKTKTIVGVLLPGVAKQFGSYMKQDKIYDDDIERINQRRLKASIDLGKYFGVASIIDRMNQDLKELLIKISISAECVDFHDDMFQNGINDLASALQIMCHETMLAVNILGLETSPGDIKAVAFEKAVENGFIPTISDIPPVIRNVPLEKIKFVIQGNTYSLQTNFLGLLYVCDNELLKKIQNECPDLLRLIAEIAELRGHGNRDFSLNNESGDILRSNFLALKDGAFKAIKTLMGVL
jgi:hypothetical protein